MTKLVSARKTMGIRSWPVVNLRSIDMANLEIMKSFGTTLIGILWCQVPLKRLMFLVLSEHLPLPRKCTENPTILWYTDVKRISIQWSNIGLKFYWIIYLSDIQSAVVFFLFLFFFWLEFFCIKIGTDHLSTSVYTTGTEYRKVTRINSTCHALMSNAWLFLPIIYPMRSLAAIPSEAEGGNSGTVGSGRPWCASLPRKCTGSLTILW